MKKFFIKIFIVIIITIYIEVLANPINNAFNIETLYQNNLQNEFTGKWSSINDKALLELDLKQNEKEIFGYHCSINTKENRIDCSTEGDSYGYTVKGTIKGNSAIITFTSTYSLKTGEAVIIRKGKLLYWKITKAPEGEFHIPTEAILKLEDK